MSVTVLLLVFFLKGGLVVTDSITAPNKETCELNRPLIMSMYYKDQFITIEDGTKVEIEDIESQCLDFSESV